jgi:hypothetical protein
MKFDQYHDLAERAEPDFLRYPEPDFCPILRALQFASGKKSFIHWLAELRL